MKSNHPEHPRFCTPATFADITRRRPSYGTRASSDHKTIKRKKREFRQHCRATMELTPAGFPND